METEKTVSCGNLFTFLGETMVSTFPLSCPNSQRGQTPKAGGQVSKGRSLSLMFSHSEFPNLISMKIIEVNTYEKAGEDC